MDTKEDLGTKSDKSYFISFFLSPTSLNTEGILILTHSPHHLLVQTTKFIGITVTVVGQCRHGTQMRG